VEHFKSKIWPTESSDSFKCSLLLDAFRWGHVRKKFSTFSCN